MFATFVNTGHIHLASTEKQTSEKASGADSMELFWGQFEDAWLLGDRLLSTSFKDAVVDELMDQLRCTDQRPQAMYKAIYKDSVGPSGMRKLLVDITTNTWKQSSLKKQAPDSQYAEFFYDVAVASMDRSTNFATSVAPYQCGSWGCGCHYHDHLSDAGCYKEMFNL